MANPSEPKILPELNVCFVRGGSELGVARAHRACVVLIAPTEVDGLTDIEELVTEREPVEALYLGHSIDPRQPGDDVR